MNIYRVLETNAFFYKLVKNKKSSTDNRTANNRYLERILQPVVGDFKISANTSDFNGWLICNGRSLNRTDYPELFAVIGTTYGNSSSTTFNLPDCRGRAVCASGQGVGLTNRALGATIGTETHTLTSAEMPTHNHEGTTSTNGNHSHGLILNEDDGNSSHNLGQHPAGDADITSNPYTISTENAGSHNHTFTTDNRGLGQAHNNMQPSIFLGNVFIYSGITIVEYAILDAVREWAYDTQHNILYESFFKNVYKYEFDQLAHGVSGVSIGVRYYISDGGNDMFDGGNYLWVKGNVFAQTAIPQIAVGAKNAITYGTLYEKPDKTGGIFVTDKGVYPHLLMTFATSGTIELQSFGNVGANGGGTVTNYSSTYTAEDGRTGVFWANITSGTSDPSICEVWFYITAADWSSTINGTIDARKTTDANDYDHSVSVTGTNYFFGHILLSKTGGATFSQPEIQQFLEEYVQTMPASMGFIA